MVKNGVGMGFMGYIPVQGHTQDSALRYMNLGFGRISTAEK
jgi:hypothetical protein